MRLRRPHTVPRRDPFRDATDRPPLLYYRAAFGALAPQDSGRFQSPNFGDHKVGAATPTNVGAKWTSTRQEFIPLSATLEMLVDAIDHRLPKGATEMTAVRATACILIPDLNHHLGGGWRRRLRGGKP